MDVESKVRKKAGRNTFIPRNMHRGLLKMNKGRVTPYSHQTYHFPNECLQLLSVFHSE